MARYIDADALKERLEDFSKWCRDGRKQGVDFVLDCPLPNIPTADVVPRAELAREIFEEIEKHGRKMQSSDFSGDFWDIAVLMSDIAELKKKYTEANHETRN